jgi:hypothetical protein
LVKEASLLLKFRVCLDPTRFHRDADGQLLVVGLQLRWGQRLGFSYFPVGTRRIGAPKEVTIGERFRQRSLLPARAEPLDDFFHRQDDLAPR